MRIIFFTHCRFADDPLFRYMYAHVSQRWDDTHVVAVCKPHGGQSPAARLRRLWKKARRVGLLTTLEIVSGYPLQRTILRRDRKGVDRALAALPCPAAPPAIPRVVRVATVNGVDAQDAMTRLRPDIIIAAGSGILKQAVFGKARIGTLNMHHGIAPSIRGMHSIYWALWERRSDWIGATIHWVDDGIDTGAVLAYASVAHTAIWEGFPTLFVQATVQGTAALMHALERLASGERWTVAALGGTGIYRSTISGWKLAALELRRASVRLPRRASGPL